MEEPKPLYGIADAILEAIITILFIFMLFLIYCVVDLVDRGSFYI
jgi:hypothetical protein